MFLKRRRRIHWKSSNTREEKLKLIEAGFEFVSADPDGTQYFRKRK